jgi:hypothetical protein
VRSKKKHYFFIRLLFSFFLFCFHIRKKFTSIGLPDPVTAIRPRGYVLNYEAAVWLHNRFGRPVAIGMRRVG